MGYSSIPMSWACHCRLIELKLSLFIRVGHSIVFKFWGQNRYFCLKSTPMMINEKKTKTLIFNFTEKYQFTTWLPINDEQIEVIDNTKLLGTIVTNDLKWDSNCSSLVKKATSRIQLLRKAARFGLDQDELKNIHVIFSRSVFEQSATVWHSSLTEDNKTDLKECRSQQSDLRAFN